jgi:glycosyltransferase involved in cell wall biosynthesis
MRIAYLLGSLNHGGTETLLLDVLRNAGKNNLDAICVYRKSGVLEIDFQECGLPLYKILKGNPLGYIFRLRKLMKENRITVAHAQQPIDALYVWLACLGTDIRVILTFHGYDFNESKLGRLILRFIIKQTDCNIFVSNALREHYQQKYHLNPDKQSVVYNGIFFDKLEVINNQDTTLRDELHLSSKNLLLGTVGNFVPGRDQLTLCHFIDQLNLKNLNFHFVFVGKRTESTPQLYDDCINYCEQHNLSDKVSFLGSRKDVPSILHQFDAFLYSTVHDTFGIAVVEAMAVGIPVFVNDWGVMNEITDQGEYATLYKTRNENDLLRVFMLFLQNKALYQDKAKEAALFVREQYSIEKHIEELKKVYEGVVINDK